MFHTVRLYGQCSSILQRVTVYYQHSQHMSLCNQQLTLSLRVSKSVSWCFEPSQPQRTASGLKTNFNLTPSYSFHKSLYHKSFLSSKQISNSIHNVGMQTEKNITHVLEPMYIPQALNMGTCIQQGDLVYSLGPTQEPMLARANTGKTKVNTSYGSNSN